MNKRIYRMAGSVRIPEKKQGYFKAYVRKVQEQCAARYGKEEGEELAYILTSVLEESFSDTPCCLMRDGGIFPVQDYAKLLQTILGRKIRLPYRGRVWELLLFLKQSGEYRDIAHPINSGTREHIQNMILDAYAKAKDEPEEQV